MLIFCNFHFESFEIFQIWRLKKTCIGHSNGLHDVLPFWPISAVIFQNIVKYFQNWQTGHKRVNSGWIFHGRQDRGISLSLPPSVSLCGYQCRFLPAFLPVCLSVCQSFFCLKFIVFIPFKHTKYESVW